MKKFLLAIAQQAPWHSRACAQHSVGPAAETPAGLSFAASAVMGLLGGLAAALIFLLSSALLATRPALVLGLLVGIWFAIPKPTHLGWSQPLGSKSAIAIGLLTVLKLEILAEIDPAWIPVVLICAAAWARVAALAARQDPLIGLGRAQPSARWVSLVIGALPLCFFGLWPEPVWGLWVAAGITLLFARSLRPDHWAAPIAVRWMACEVIYCLCALALMSAASLSEFAEEAPPGS